MPRRLPDRIRRPLEPVAALGCLLGGEHFDEAIREHVHPVGLRHVPVERRRIELREDEDPLEARVHAVADRDVDQAVLAAERHGGFRAHPGEGKEAGAASAAEDEREYVVHIQPHSSVRTGGERARGVGHAGGRLVDAVRPGPHSPRVSPENPPAPAGREHTDGTGRRATRIAGDN